MKATILLAACVVAVTKAKNFTVPLQRK